MPDGVVGRLFTEKVAMRVAMIGYGAVGSVHASQLAAERGVNLVTVFGPKREKASAFASAHRIKHVSETLEEAISHADAAIVCSPSYLHYRQALECLQLGVHTLVEMPPCETVEQAEALGELAQDRGVRLECAHTSRYLAPYARITAGIRTSELGPIQEINYVRHHRLRDRSWTDDAMLHHAAHPIDLLLDWFEDLTPRGCVALPQVFNAQTVSMLCKLSNGAPATISITYASRLPHVRMLIVGDQHTVETDGFSYIRSDLKHLEFNDAEQLTYERAIHDQDIAFLSACGGKRAGIDWKETLKLMRIINCFQRLGNQ